MQTQFTTDDHITLGGYVLRAEQPKAAVLLNPGTATKTTFYLPFAHYLVEQGYSVLLWNYRGFCESRQGSLAGCPHTYADIGQHDMPAAIDHAKTLFPDLPLYCVGHSAGGQQVGFAPNHTQIKGFVAIAVSAGHFAFMPLPYRLKAYFFFYMFAPISRLLKGYVAAKKWNLMEDLPGPLAREWGQWCAEKDMFFSPKYYGRTVPKGAYHDLNMPIHVITVEDDEISTAKNVQNFWAHIKSRQPITFKCYQLTELAQKSVGHFGYFRKSSQLIWQDVVATLDSFPR